MKNKKASDRLLWVCFILIFNKNKNVKIKYKHLNSNKTLHLFLKLSMLSQTNGLFLLH